MIQSIQPEYGRLDVDAFLDRLGVAGHAVEDLAKRWRSPRPPTSFRLVAAFAVAGVELSEYQGIRAWVAIDQAVADHQRSQVVGDAIVDAAFVSQLEHGDLGPGLHVPDEDLAHRLPLLDLAQDLARRDGRLVVENRAPDGLWGCVSVTPARGAVVCLDGALDDEDLARTFAHELAHELDPDGSADVDWRGVEAFADALGPMLLEAEPVTVKATVFLVMRALDTTAALRTPKPDGSLASLLELVLAEVGATQRAEPELRAACRAVPGVKRWESEG